MRTKNIKSVFQLALVTLTLVLANNCINFNSSDSDGEIPEIVTGPIYSITKNTANSGGDITSDGGISILAHGVCWSIKSNPTIDDNKTVHKEIDKIGGRAGGGVFKSSLTGLSPYITYYVRAYATNRKGTAYGNELIFTTLPVTIETGSVNYNNYIYLTVKIGTQWWFAENLQTKKFNDGNEIPYLIPGTISADSENWKTTRSPAYSLYFKYTSPIVEQLVYFKNIYGPFYNWYAVNTGMLCPKGWHVPTDSDWTKLTDYLINNGYQFQNRASMIAKSIAATTGWNNYSKSGTPGNDVSSNNASGFSGFPSGYIDENGQQSGKGGYTYWWAANEYSVDKAKYRTLNYSIEFVGGGSSSLAIDKNSGFSVRCVKN